MKTILLSSFSGIGLTTKIITAVVAIVVAAGGALYALSQKSYAPETIQFDGRTFYLLSERNGDTGEVISVYDDSPGEAMYVAVYLDSPDAALSDSWFYYQVLYAATPAPEFVREDGAYSAVAFKEKEWGGANSNRAPFHQIRKSDNDSIASLWAFETPEGTIRLYPRYCGASRKNAFICLGFNGAYPGAKEWAESEGAAELERIYNSLAEYPLLHNEELLADMAAAAK